MEIQMLYPIAKALHVAGFIVSIGVTLTSFMAYKQFWKLYQQNRTQGIAAFATFKPIQRIGMIGLLLAFAAGLCMLALTDWALVNSRWFQVKLGLVGLLLLNGFTLGRIGTVELNAMISAFALKEFKINPDANRVHALLRWFQVIQLCIFAVIIIISILR